MRIAIIGKGGAGKSVIAGTMARLLARRGRRVLALDSDFMPGLSISLGAGPQRQAPLDDAAERDENGRWRLKKGVGPVRAVRRYATEAPDGVLFLQFGKMPAEGTQPIMGSVNAYYRVIHRLGDAPAFRDWDIVCDMPAGPRQMAFGWAPFAETFLVVATPTWQSGLTARRTARIARKRPGVTVLPVANQVRTKADTRHVEKILREPVFASLPASPEAAEADRLGIALIDHAPDSNSVRAIDRLADELMATSLESRMVAS